MLHTLLSPHRHVGRAELLSAPDFNGYEPKKLPTAPLAPGIARRRGALDCFELAWDIRVLDMRGSPYDLADLGLDPVRIETAEGKRAYADAQAAFAERGAPLRARLVETCEGLLA